MRAVSNSTPLIFLAKIGRIQLLAKIFEGVLIPKEVYSEVVIRGKAGGHPDSVLVEELINKDLIIVRDVEVTVLKDAPVDEGEKAAISLALEEGIEEVLIDEGKVRRMARLLGLKPRGTLWVLSKLYEEGFISKKEFKTSVFDLIEKGYRIREDILIDLLEEVG